MSYQTRIISYHNRARLFWALVAISILALGIYIYSINTLARNVALRQNLERQIVKTSADLDLLEFAHIELKNNITIELAHDYGFKEAGSPLFVSRARPLSLSFNTPSH